MANSMIFHRATNVRLDHTFCSNSNSISFVIEYDGRETEITIFDLPTDVTKKFDAFRDERTEDYK